jgi:hypothetical protein
MISITMIKEKRGIQRDRSKIRVWRGKKFKNDRFPNDPGKKGNPMRYVSNKGAGRSLFLFFFSFFPFSFPFSFFFFTSLRFYADMNNTVVSKCINS